MRRWVVRDVVKRTIASVMTAVLVFGGGAAGQCLAASVYTQEEESAAGNIVCVQPKINWAEGYIDDGIRVESIEDDTDAAELGLLSEETLPAAYGSVNATYLPAVRNQNPYGTCWAMSVVAAEEISAILQEKAVARGADAINLSELQLAYFAWNHGLDHMGMDGGDLDVYTGDSTYLNAGGSALYGIRTLENWYGVAQESTDTSLVYPSGQGKDAAPVLKEDLQNAWDYHLKNAYMVSMQDKEIIKNLILRYGCVVSAYYHDKTYYSARLLDKVHTYCQKKTQATNHAVTLVGWDDDYPAQNFSSACRPDEDGAWLVRNSWGTGDYDNGYMWISYEDLSLGNDEAWALEAAEAGQVDYNYQYDGSVHGSFKLEMSSGGSLANVFDVQAKGSGNELLKSVSVELMSPQTKYTLEIYKNLSDRTTPTSGDRVAVQTGTFDYAGFHTVDLEEPVALSEEEDFSVVFTVSREDGEKISASIDGSCEYGMFSVTANAQKGESFCNDSGRSWSDYSQMGYNFRIKAYTQENDTLDPQETKPAATPGAEETQEPIVTENPGVTASEKPSDTPQATATVKPGTAESAKPSATPRATATVKPGAAESAKPSATPQATATVKPGAAESAKPSATPRATATVKPGAAESAKPSATPRATATVKPGAAESAKPSATPRATATVKPGVTESAKPSATPQATATTKPVPDATQGPQDSTDTGTALVKGSRFVSGGLIYQVKAQGCVAVAGVSTNKKTSTAITLPKKVAYGGVNWKITAINTKAFSRAVKLKKLTVKCQSLTSVAANAFRGTPKKLVIKVPKKCRKQYKKLFKKTGCTVR